jgi:hypothetical protein
VLHLIIYIHQLCLQQQDSGADRTWVCYQHM